MPARNKKQSTLILACNMWIILQFHLLHSEKKYVYEYLAIFNILNS